MASSCCCGLSRQQRRHLHLNTPLWRLIIFLRSLTVLIACLVIAAFVVCISVPLSVAERLERGGNGNGNGNNAWQWGDLWIESFAFVPPAVSLLQSVVTIPYLLSTSHLTHPAAELVIELILVLAAAFPIIFCATVSGPLQRWQSSGASSSAHLTNNDQLAGYTELIGFIGLCLLEIFHFGFFVAACCRMHVKRRGKIALARAAAMKLEAGWGVNEDEIVGLGVGFRGPETRREEVLPEPRPDMEQQIDNYMEPPSPAKMKMRAREENAQMEERLGGARRPSSVSALSSRRGRRSSSWGRRPSSLDGHMPQGRRRTDASQIGMAVGKPHEIWVPITELRSESPLTPHRVVEDHEVVIVGDGEVKVVSTPREEVFMGWTMPEPATPRMGGEKWDHTKAEVEAQAEVDGNAKMVMKSPDPDVPAPLKVRKSVKIFKTGNSWEMDKVLQEPPVADMGW